MKITVTISEKVGDVTHDRSASVCYVMRDPVATGQGMVDVVRCLAAGIEGANVLFGDKLEHPRPASHFNLAKGREVEYLGEDTPRHLSRGMRGIVQADLLVPEQPHVLVKFKQFEDTEFWIPVDQLRVIPAP